jgi:hypothetical protein
MKGPLRPDLQKVWVALDKADDRAVFVDANGDAWQKSARTGFWYRAFDSDGIDPFTLAQMGAGGRVIKVKP